MNIIFFFFLKYNTDHASCFCPIGGLCQNSPLCRSRHRLPHQYAVCVPAVGADLSTGQDAGGVQRGPPPALHDPACLRRPGAQYPLWPPRGSISANSYRAYPNKDLKRDRKWTAYCFETNN